MNEIDLNGIKCLRSHPAYSLWMQELDPQKWADAIKKDGGKTPLVEWIAYAMSTAYHEGIADRK